MIATRCDHCGVRLMPGTQTTYDFHDKVKVAVFRESGAVFAADPGYTPASDPWEGEVTVVVRRQGGLAFCAAACEAEFFEVRAARRLRRELASA